MKKYKVGGLFSGVGGIELGFEKAGYKIAWSNEFNKNACITYRHNFKKHLLIEDDMYNIIDNNFIHDNKNLDEIDILVGGFPCQAFSIAGYRKGFEDTRGNLFFAIKKFIARFQPKAFMLENVKNLYGHDNGNTFKRIYNELDQLGYSVLFKVLNTAKYSTIPQNRERIFIIGFKDESDWNDKKHFSKESVCSNSFDFPSKMNYTKSIEDIIEKTDLDDIYYYTKEKSYMYDLLFESIKSRKTTYQWRRKYVRENKSGLCPTLTANMGTGGHNVPLILDYKNKIRKLTPKECFSFQGYGKSFKLPELANSHLYMQSGNSVTVPLIKRIATQIKVALDSKYS